MRVSPKQTMTHNKLLLLYLLAKSDIQLSELQIMRISNELEFMGYFDLKECVFELTQNDHIQEISTPHGVLYRITDQGREIVRVLETDVRQSFRRAIDDYLRDNKPSLFKESRFIGEHLKLRDGEYRVSLKALEKNEPVFEINLIVPTRDEARAMVDGWTENAVSVYQDIVLKLRR